ncbi:MAG TPA: T9SS type A sorting domain-containing protein [Flavobacterium sp.]|nr:T9SS type A sorting domain-containing protein [Flavobacterium sp.]
MIRYFSILTLMISSIGLAQSRVRFQYDSAGNQVQRTYCISCAPRYSNPADPIATPSDKEVELEKFFPGDDISYYPNPVKEELFIKWELTESNFVTHLRVFSSTGQLLYNVKKSKSDSSHSFSFGTLPVGVYFIDLAYENGEEKTIKIIKQ